MKKIVSALALAALTATAAHAQKSAAVQAIEEYRAMLAQLSQGEASVGELAAPFDLSAAAITKPLKVLQRAGLVVQGRAAQWRPCRLRAQPLGEPQWFGHGMVNADVVLP